jgi:hypothetical protein
MPSYQRNPKSIRNQAHTNAVFVKCIRNIVLPFVEICRRLVAISHKAARLPGGGGSFGVAFLIAGERIGEWTLLLDS